MDILDVEMLGLLDSGSTRTILGNKGWSILSRFCLPLNTSRKIVCVLADGTKCETTGVCTLPIKVRDRLRLIDVVVAPDLPRTLILGRDFWIKLGIVPDLRRDEWYFSKLPEPLDTISVEKDCQLTPGESVLLKGLLDRYLPLLGEGIGCTTVAEHVILSKSAPIKQKYYRVSPVMQKMIDKELEEMLEKDVIEESNSPWSSPIILVRKKDNSYRFCVDFRRLNAVTERDSYPLPNISDTLDKLKDAQYLSSIDIKSAYWQVPVAENSKKYTAFTVPNRGLFQFRKMPFGLHNAPATWQRLIDKVLGPKLEPHVFVYLDDIVIVTQTFEKHLEVLEEVFRRLLDANLSVNQGKCQFCVPSMKYLGYVVDRNGLHVDPDKVRAMLNLPVPTNAREVRRVVGTFSWYRRFIPEFSTIIAPLTALTRKRQKFQWTSECEESFQKIKECLVAAPVLNCPDYSLPFVVQTDASGYGIGAVLTQPHPDGDRVISYLSRSLSRQERQYSTTERECLAVIYAVEKLRPYLEGVSFTVITDHYSLKWLLTLKDPTGRLARWSVRIQQYDFTIVHRKGSDHVIPDMLSRAVPIIDSIHVSDSASDTPDVHISDKWYLKMIEQVEKYPLKYSGWRVSGKALFKYVKQDYPELREENDYWKRVIPKNERKVLINMAHDPPMAGHMGIFKTYNRLTEKYYWPKMRSDVTSYVRRCQTCLAYKPTNQRPADKMLPHPKPSRPWEIVSTDLMGPLPRSKRGNMFVLVVTDYLSKFSVIFALKKATTQAVVRRMEEEVFLIFGVPRIIITDNGPQYRSKEFQRFARDYGCQIKYSSNYHPRANPTERTNRNLKIMMSMYAADNHRTWDVELQKLACALRTCRHEVTRLTPYYVNFGRNMALSGEDYAGIELKSGSPENGTQEATSSRNEAFRHIFTDVKRRLEMAGQKSADAYNLRRRHEVLQKDQLVWRKNHVLSDAANYFSRKLAPKFVGPYYIHRRLSPWTYELRDADGKVLTGTWNIKDLKTLTLDSENELKMS